MGRNSTNNDNSAVGAEFASVVSPNGFSTGDLVYRSPNGYGVMPSGAISSGSVPLSPSPIFAPSFQSSGNISNHFDTGGNGIANHAAKLSNGNIVVVYIRASTVYFKVFDSNNATVVAETSPFAFSINGGYACVAVVAFTGGFVIWSPNGSNQLSNRAFTNAGIANYATVNTGLTFNSYNPTQFLYLIPRPDGRHVVVWSDSTAQSRFAVYNSTDGTAYFASTAFGTITGAQAISTGAIVFNDNSFVVFTNPSNNQCQWYRRDATGAAVTNTFFSVNNVDGIQMVLLNNGNAAFYYKNTSNQLCYRSFTTSTNTVGSETVLIASAIAGSSSPVNAYTVPGTNTNIVFFTWDNATTPYRAYEALAYIVVDGSTGTVTYGGTNPLTVLGMNPFIRNNYMTFVDLGTKVRAYMTTTGIVVSNTTPVATPSSQIYLELDTSSFSAVNFSSVSGSYSTITGVATGAYSKTNSTPASVYFAAAANSNPLSSSPASGTVLLNQTVVSAETTVSMKLLQLSTGNILVAWCTNTGSIKFKVYSQSFIEIASVTAVAVGLAGTTYGFSVTEFPDGKIAVMYDSGAGTIIYKVFSSSFVEIQGATTLIGTSPLGAAWDACALNYGSNRLVAVYVNPSSVGTWIVRDQAGTSIATNTFGSATFYSTGVAPLRNGGFVIGFNRGGSTNASQSYYPNSNFTNYTVAGTMTGGSVPDSNYITQGAKITAVSPQGTHVQVYTSGSTTINYEIVGTMIPGGTVRSGTLPTANAANSQSFISICVNSEGWFAGIYGQATGANQPFMFSGQASYTGASISTTVSQFTTSPFISSWYATPYLSATICPLYGSYFVVGLLSSAQYPTIAAVSAYNRSYPAQVLSGTTQIGPVTIDPSNGFSLIGVAASDCAAGGAGRVQTKGTAVLSSSYPTTTQTFDFTNPVTYGVKGTVSNRVITLED